MISERIEVAGRRLAEAWRSARAIDPLSADLAPRDLAEARAIQEEMARHVGHPVVGWKVGGAPGPLVGRVFAPTLFASPAILPADRFGASRIECEIGFRVLDALPSRRRAYSEAEVGDASRLALLVEITVSRIKGGRHIAESEADILAIVADNAVQGGLVVGPEFDAWRHLDLLGIAVDLRIDGGLPLPVNPRAGRTDPFAVMLWLANELSARGIGLAAGQLVTTGSATLSQPLAPGRSAIAIYGDLGEIRVAVAS